MKCPVCDCEMILWKATETEDEYVCRNKRCPQFDERLRKPKEETEETK